MRKSAFIHSYTIGYVRMAMLVVTFLIFLSANATTHFVTFNDGRVHVFPDSCVASTTTTGTTVSFSALDGTVYIYPISQIASITQVPVRELPSITSFKFNNKYNYQVITDAVGVITDNEITAQVIGIGKRLTASFELSDDMASLYDGYNELQSKVNRLRYDTTRVLTAGYRGDMILSHDGSGAYALKPYGKEYTVRVAFLTDQATEVPRIDINTVGGVSISSQEYYLDAEIIIDGKGVFPSMTDSVKVKGRGNSSWSIHPSSKNPYRLKFSSKVKPLGLTKGKNWVLLSNKIMGALMTNSIGMKAASLIGTAAANHIIPVDLYVNGKYKGNYNFTEKVGLSNNSVDLDDETVAALLELDVNYDEAVGQKFRSSAYNLPVNIKDPEFGEDSTLLSLEDIKQRFDAFLAALYDGTGIEDYADIDMLARYLLLNDLIFNKEVFQPKSLYCYNENILDDDSKFIFGPAWDFDWAFGYTNATSTTYFNENVTADYYTSMTHITNYVFLTAMRQDPKVGRRLYEVCRDFMKNGLDELCEFCQDYYQYARPSLILNNTADYDDIDYSEQSVRAANWLRERVTYIYETLKQEQIIPGDMDDDGILSIADLTLLIDYILTGDASIVQEVNPDVDDDGMVGISDISTLIDQLLFQQ